MMANFLKALLLLPVAILVVLLAVANRGPVTLSLDPFSRGGPEVSFTLPLFAALFAALALGVVIGGIASWTAQGKHRQARRSYKREVSHLRTEADRLRSQPQGAGVPALPPMRSRSS